MSIARIRPVIPDELPHFLRSLSYEVIKQNPKDIISFAAEFFQQMYDEREQAKLRGKEASDESDDADKPHLGVDEED